MDIKNALVKLFKLEDILKLHNKCKIARNELDAYYIKTRNWHCDCGCELCETCRKWFDNRNWKINLVEKLYGEP